MLNGKVLHLASDYPWANLYQNLFDVLEDRGVKEYIYVFVNREFVQHTIYPENVVVSPCFHKLERVIFHLKHRRVFHDMVRKFTITNFGLIHAHSLFSNGYVAYRAHKEFGVPYIVTVRNTDLNVFFKMMLHLRGLGVKIMLNASKVIFISRPYKNNVITQFVPNRHKSEISEKSAVIPNGINRFWLNNRVCEKTLNQSDGFNIIYAGAINKNKNVVTTIEACNILIQRGFNVKFRIVGKIEDKTIGQLITNNPFVEHVPYCPKEDLIDHIRSADIFVMPSKNETFGLVYAEAMTQGLPIIYTRDQGFDGRFEQGEVGYSVQHSSPTEIAERILDIIENYDAISARCVQESARFDWDIIAEQYVKIYSKILGTE